MLCLLLCTSLSISELHVKNIEVGEISKFQICEKMTFENVTLKRDNMFIPGVDSLNGCNSITIINSNFSGGKIIKGQNNKGPKKVTIDVINTIIEKGLEGEPCVEQLNFVGCMFDLSKFDEELTGERMRFEKCEFINSVPKEKSAFILISKKQLDKDDVAVDRGIKIEFIDCKFNTKDTMNEGGRQFLAIRKQEGRMVNIVFERCITGQNVYEKSMKLVKIACNQGEEQLMTVQGRDVGFNVEKSFVYSNGDNDVFTVESNWTIAVNGNNYYPEATPTSSPTANKNQNNNNSSDEKWKKIAFIGIAIAAIMLIVVIVVLIIAKKKKRDKYSN